MVYIAPDMGLGEGTEGSKTGESTRLGGLLLKASLNLDQDRLPLA